MVEKKLCPAVMSPCMRYECYAYSIDTYEKKIYHLCSLLHCTLRVEENLKIEDIVEKIFKEHPSVIQDALTMDKGKSFIVGLFLKETKANKKYNLADVLKYINKRIEEEKIKEKD